MKMTVSRMILFFSLLLAVGLMLQQCWQAKPESEKWLYFFEDAATDYAGQVLGIGRGTDVPIPEELAKNKIAVHDNHVTFSPIQNTKLILAFSPVGIPAANPDGDWIPVRDAWYSLKRP